MWRHGCANALFKPDGLHGWGDSEDDSHSPMQLNECFTRPPVEWKLRGCSKTLALLTIGPRFTHSLMTASTSFASVKSRLTRSNMYSAGFMFLGIGLPISEKYLIDSEAGPQYATLPSESTIVESNELKT